MENRQILKESLNVKPVIDTDLNVEVKGYGCDDDCDVWFSNANSSCGWRETTEYCWFW